MTGTEKQKGFVKAPPPAPLEVSGQATPDLIPTLRHRACDFAAAHAMAPKAIEAVALAVTEAVTNVVKHAYEPETADRGIWLTGSVSDHFLEVTVADRGLGFRESACPGLGLGLSLIAEMSADLDIAQGSEGTRLRMRFLLA